MLVIYNMRHKNGKTLKCIKISLYLKMAIPAQMYGSESWVMKDKS